MPDRSTPYPHLVHKKPGLCEEKGDTVAQSNGGIVSVWESTKGLPTIFIIALSIAVQTVLDHLSVMMENSKLISFLNMLIILLYKTTLVPVALTLPDRFGGEPCQKTTTQNPPAESDDRATSSHNQNPISASSLRHKRYIRTH